MALPEVYGVALEAQAVVQSAAEVLGRLSKALNPSNQLMSAWMQERDVLYTRQRQLEQQVETGQQQAATCTREFQDVTSQQRLRIEQLEAHAQELQAALDSLRAGTQAAQHELSAERQQLQHVQQQQQAQQADLERERQELEQQWRQLEQQRLGLAAQARDLQAKEAAAALAQAGAGTGTRTDARTPQARKLAGLRSPGTDSDVSLPPSQPRLRVDRVPETLFLGWGEELMDGDDGAAGVGGGAAARRAEAAGAEAAAGAVQLATAPGPLSPPNTIGTGICSLAQGQDHDGGAGALAAAQAAWAAREQQLTQDYAAQLQALWAENNALQSDLQSALAYRRTAHELRSSNQALQQQLEELQRQLYHARSAASAAATAPPAPRVSVATSPVRSPTSPDSGHQHDNRAGAATAAGPAPLPTTSAGDPERTLAIPPGAEPPADANPTSAAHQALFVQVNSLAAERDRLLIKYREAKSACREAKQLARHWQNAYLGLMAAHEGPEAVQEAKRRMGPNAQQEPEADAAAAAAVTGPGAAPPAAGEAGPAAWEAGNAGCDVAGLHRGGSASARHISEQEQACGVATPGVQHAPASGLHSGGPVWIKQEVQEGCIGVKDEPVEAAYGGPGPGHHMPERCPGLAVPGPGQVAASGGEWMGPAVGAERPEFVAGAARGRGRTLPYPRLRRPSEARAEQGGTLGARPPPPLPGDLAVGLGDTCYTDQGDQKFQNGRDDGGDDDEDADEVDLTQEPSEGGAQARGGEVTRHNSPRGPPPYAQQHGQQQPQLQQQGIASQEHSWRHVPAGQQFEGPRHEPVQRRPGPACDEAVIHAVGDAAPAAAACGAGQAKPMPGATARRSSSDGGAVADLAGGAQGQGQGPGGGGGGWMSKRSRSWDGMDTEGGGGAANGGGAGSGNGARCGGAGGGGRAASAAPRPDKAAASGRRYVQQQLPFGWQRPPSQGQQQQQQQQQGATQPRRHRTPPSQQLAEHGVSLEAVRQAAPPTFAATAGAGAIAAAAAAAGAAATAGAGMLAAAAADFSDDEDFVIAGEKSAPRPLAAVAAGNSDMSGAGAAPPPRKRKALGPAGAAVPTGSGVAQQPAPPQRPPKAPSPFAAAGMSDAAGPAAADPQPEFAGAGISNGTATRVAAGAGGGGTSRGAGGAAGGAAGPGPNGAAGGGGASGATGGAAVRGEPGYRYTAVVRGRAEREALEVVECAGCKAFYEAIATWGDALAPPPTCNHVQKAQAAGPAAGGAAAAGSVGAAVRRGTPPQQAQAEQQQQQQQEQQQQQQQTPQQPAGNMASALRQAGGRHRFKYAPPATPEGFWDIGFGDTQD